MPLEHGYGVLIGTINNYLRDDPDKFGRYFHGNLEIQAPAGEYRWAIDVDSHQSNTGVEWRTVPLNASELSQITGLSAGFQALASNSSTGAVDYVRSPMFAARVGCLAIIYALLRIPFDFTSIWKRGTSLQALGDLEPLVTTTQTGNLLALVFGEPFTQGLGMHNIHQN
jgi:hypothetical protein